MVVKILLHHIVFFINITTEYLKIVLYSNLNLKYLRIVMQ